MIFRSVDEEIASMSGFHSSMIVFQWLGQKIAHLIYLFYVMYSHSALTKSIDPGRLSCGLLGALVRERVLLQHPG